MSERSSETSKQQPTNNPPSPARAVHTSSIRGRGVGGWVILCLTRHTVSTPTKHLVVPRFRQDKDNFYKRFHSIIHDANKTPQSLNFNKFHSLPRKTWNPTLALVFCVLNVWVRGEGHPNDCTPHSANVYSLQEESGKEKNSKAVVQRLALTVAQRMDRNHHLLIKIQTTRQPSRAR